MNFETFDRATDILCDLNVLGLDITAAAARRADLRSTARLLDGVIDRLDVLTVSAAPAAAIAAGLEDVCDDLYGVCGALEHAGELTLAACVQARAEEVEALRVH